MMEESTISSDDDIEQPEVEKAKSSSKRSLVWEYFSKKDKSNATCNCCGKTLQMGKTTSTTCLANHLKQHYKIYQEFNKNKRKREEEKIGTAEKSSAPPKKQNTITNMMSPIKLAKKRQEEITSAIGNMIAYDLHSYSLVTEDSFINLMRVLEPRYEIPHRTTFSRSIIPEMYRKEKSRVKDVISKEAKDMLSMAFTTDCWTSVAGDSYMSLTMHYVNEAFALKTFVLDTRQMTNAHTAGNILDILTTMVEDWEFPSTIPTFVVSDNAANIKAAINKSGNSIIFCFAHTLQLVVADALKETTGVVDLVKQARSIVGHYKHSTSAMIRLKSMQEKLGVPQHDLVQDVVTRWNSQHDMLARLVEQREAVAADITSNPDIENLTNTQWKMAAGLVEVLSPFKEATTDLCGHQYPTMSMVIPVLHCLDKVTGKFVSESESGTGIGFARNLVKSLKSRFPFLNKKDVHYIMSMCIDPRYKMVILNHEEKLFAHMKLQDMCKKLNQNRGLDYADQESDSSKPSTSRTEPLSSVWKVLDEIPEERVTERDLVTTEIESFLKLPRIGRNESPLDWWRQNRYQFPNLCKVALFYLGLPATQAPSERLFSTSTNIVTCKRANILPEHVKEMCFLHSNKMKS